MESTNFQVIERSALNQLSSTHSPTLSASILSSLLGVIETFPITEVQQVYQIITDLISADYQRRQQAIEDQHKILQQQSIKAPYILAVVGSVAVGKSTVARLLHALLTRPPHQYRAKIIPTDAFLCTNTELERQNLIDKKGFPCSYHKDALIHFLTDLKAGKHPLYIPTYSHERYDIIPHEMQKIDQYDIIILEGLNILNIMPQETHFVSDWINNSLYVDAPCSYIQQWFTQRFMHFRDAAKQDDQLFYHQFSKMSDSEALSFINHIWHDINARNLNENILPYRHRANMIVTKNIDHTAASLAIKTE